MEIRGRICQGDAPNAAREGVLPMRVRATAPTRIDLAGGTLDIYPLYLFEEGGLTVNMGIDLLSEVTLEPRPGEAIHLVSEDTGDTLSAPDVGSLGMDSPLGFVARVVRYYRPPVGLTIRTKSNVPKGSGLGASSSLLISLTGALCRLNGTSLDEHTMVDLAANLEAQSIGVPTGKQDYWPAVRGGVNALWFDVPGTRVEPLVVSEEVLSELEERLVLCFTTPHVSSVTNWGMMKNYIDDAGTTRRNLRAIKETAFAMREALLGADFERLAAVLDEEWQNRKRMAEGVTTPPIEAMIAAAAGAGALASKVCGAGGGGCMITLAPPGRREAVARALQGAGATLLEYRIARQGLTVTVQED
jgi:D-glycero-alpha-D-manno-heptose-7-phosphate kinase